MHSDIRFSSHVIRIPAINYFLCGLTYESDTIDLPKEYSIQWLEDLASKIENVQDHRLVITYSVPCHLLTANGTDHEYLNSALLKRMEQVPSFIWEKSFDRLAQKRGELWLALDGIDAYGITPTTKT